MKIRRGFSIIETVLYVAILIMIMATMVIFLINVVRRESKVTMVLEVNQNARFALEKMNAVIRNSKDATLPADGGGSGPTLSLTMPDSSVSPTVFAVTNGVLTMKQGTAAAVPLTSSAVKVSNLTFTNLVDPTAHARTSPAWVLCNDAQHNSVWYCVICHVSDQKDYCWDQYPDYLSGGWFLLLLDLLFGQAKLGSCLQATAAKSVMRIAITVSAPPSGVVTNDYSASVTLYATATIPRQN
jgi:hypothetical protein